jgi:hypothetical protein
VSKKKEADAAYLRAEAQRALALVLTVAEDHGERPDSPRAAEIAAACVLVRAEFLKVTAPARTERVLAGQLTIEGAIEEGEGSGVLAPRPNDGFAHWPSIPPHCPECKRFMTIESGWTPLKPEELRRLQCGACSNIIVVPRGSYDTLALALRSRFAAIDSPMTKK